MGIKAFLIPYLFGQFFSSYPYSHFLPTSSLPLPKEEIYHFAFLNITPERPKEIIFFGKNSFFVTDINGKVITQKSFPHQIIASYACSTALYLITPKGVYRLTLSDLTPRAIAVVSETILGSFPLSSTQLAVRTKDNLILYTLSYPLLKESFRLPSPQLHSGTRVGQNLYFVDSTNIYRYSPPKGKLTKDLSLKKKKILGIFNLNEKLYLAIKKGQDLYLSPYERKPLRKEIPVLPLKEGGEITEADPFLFLSTPHSAYLLTASGFKEEIYQSVADAPLVFQKDGFLLRVLDLNDDGLNDLAILNRTGLEVYINRRRNLLIRKEQMVENFSRTLKRGKREEAELSFLLAHFFNDLANMDDSPLWQLKRRADTNYYTKRIGEISLFFLSLFIPIGLFLYLLIRQAKGKRSLAKRDVSELVKIAYEIITLDHNFLIKGNLPAGLNKLAEITRRYRIPKEEIPADIWQEKEYKRFLAKFLSSPYLVSLSEFLTERLKEVEASSMELFLEEGTADVVLFIDPTIESIFTHILSDNFRHRRSKSWVKVSYRHTTDWSRKVRFSFFSDAETKPNLKEGHLAEDLALLQTAYGPYFSYGEGSEEKEKLWVTFLDIVGIIKGIMKR